MRYLQRRIEITSVTFFLFVFFTTLILDQGVKYSVQRYSDATGSFFRFTENSGIAFSIPMNHTLLWGGLIAILFFLLILCRRSIVKKRVMESMAYALILGGGVGNSMDRIRFGAVHDTFVLPGGLLFNMADLAIIIGLLFLLLWPRKSTPLPS